MKLVLHIGMSKAGSTLIQYFCLENRKTLLENGVLFPKTGFSENPDGREFRASGHYFLIPAIKNNDLNMIENFKKEIKRCKKANIVLLSSENFSLQPEIIPSFQTHFSQFKESKIIVYLRRQDLYLESLYGEFISGGWRKITDDPEEFFLDYIGNIGRIECNYYLLLDSWAKAFGKTNIIVRPFEQKQWLDGDLIKDFFKGAGLPWSDTYKDPPEPAKNVSPPAQVNKIIRYLNRIPLQGIFYRSAIAKFFQHELKDYPAEPKQFFASPDLRLTVLRRYAASNRRVAQEYLNRKNGKLFYSPYPKKNDAWEPVKITDTDLLAQIASLFLEQKSIEIQEILEKHRGALRQTRQGQESLIGELDSVGRYLSDVKDEMAHLRSEIAENKKLLSQTRQELVTFRNNAWKTIKRHGKSLNQRKQEIKQNKRKQEWTHNLLYRQVLTTYLRARKSPWRRLCRFLRSPILNETRLLHDSGLVDPHYYFTNYPDVINAGMTAAKHYVRFGAQEGRNPSENFNTLKYLAEHPDVTHKGLNPLISFFLHRRDQTSVV